MRLEIPTPRGVAWADVLVPSSGEPLSLLVLGHGAGGDVGAPDLVAVRDAAATAGVATVLVTQPYRVVGRRAPAPAGHLDEAWRAVLAALVGTPAPAEPPPAPGGPAGPTFRPEPGAPTKSVPATSVSARSVPAASVSARSVPAASLSARSVPAASLSAGPVLAASGLGASDVTGPVLAASRLATGAGVPVIVGGRSSGARVACRTAGAVGAAAVLALAFPTHPPGRPERSRVDELSTGLPTLVINGDRDPFGVPPTTPGVTVLVRPGERHDLRGDPPAVGRLVVGWLRDHGWARPVGQPGGRPSTGSPRP